jgi:hypothetical protein
MCGGALKIELVVDSALMVLKDPLDCTQVRLLGIIHVEADLLDNIHDLEPGEGKIPKITDKTVVGSGVIDRGTIAVDLGLHVHWCGSWLAIQHVSSPYDTMYWCC